MSNPSAGALLDAELLDERSEGWYHDGRRLWSLGQETLMGYGGKHVRVA